MIFAASLAPEVEAAPAGHAGFLVGCYRNGTFSDAWTDVSRCADGTFIGYAPACSCGWRGPLQPATARGRLLSSRDWRNLHLTQGAGTPLRVPAAS